jgi:hypothetical protein
LWRRVREGCGEGREGRRMRLKRVVEEWGAERTAEREGRG